MGALLAAGAEVDLTDDDGFSALGVASENGHAEAARALLSARSDPNLGECRVFCDGVDDLIDAEGPRRDVAAVAEHRDGMGAVCKAGVAREGQARGGGGRDRDVDGKRQGVTVTYDFVSRAGDTV